jgi:hypothetical protein
MGWRRRICFRRRFHCGQRLFKNQTYWKVGFCMARIIVSYYQTRELSLKKYICFIDGFAQDLRKCGNDVFLINTAFFNTYQSNIVQSPELDAALLERAKKFGPELIITLNHRIPKSFLEYFDVPIVIWDGDELSLFCDHDYMRANLSRYKIFSISKAWYNDYTEFGFKENQISYIPQATSVRKEDIEQAMNVSFVGARFTHNNRYSNIIKGKVLGSNQFNEVVKAFLNTGNYDYQYLFHKYFPFDVKYPGLDYSDLDLYPLFDYRWLVLSNMLDLGLTIAGYNVNWENTVDYMPQLAAAYDPKLMIWNLEENSRFYNSSKVSLCPMHPQAKGSAFAWRAFDIMASNACLLVSDSSELKELTKDYLDMPMYTTPWQARDLCIKMLGDDEYRLGVVEASQKYVEENARWVHRFRDAEQALGMKLVQTATDEGKLTDAILGDLEIQEKLTIPDKKLLFPDKKYDAKEPKKPIFQNIRDKIVALSPMHKILALVKNSALILLLGIAALFANEYKVLEIIGLALAWCGIAGFIAAGSLGLLNACLKVKRFIQG